jgi:hypothetical protein
MLRMGMMGGVMLIALSGMGLARESGVMAAQRGTNQPNPTLPTNQPGGVSPLDQPEAIPDGGMRARMDAQRLKSANDDRHKKLASDVDRLVSLTNELKVDVDKANKDELSLDVIRKAQEIEKLAHDVQNRMKN